MKRWGSGGESIYSEQVLNLEDVRDQSWWSEVTCAKRIELMCNINRGSMGRNEWNEAGKTLGFNLFLMECFKQDRMTVLERLVRLQQMLW